MSSVRELSRRRLLRLTGAAAATAATTTLAGCSPWAVGRALCAHPDTDAAALPGMPPANAAEALARLLAGNRRYAAGASIPLHESPARRAAITAGQHPFATVFGCVDSRVPPELLFDAGLGDLFVIRTAGHVLDGAVLGSLQFGVAELSIPLLLVLGHERCGAVKATIDTLEAGGEAEAEIAVLVDAIRPAVEQAQDEAGDLAENAMRAHVEFTVETLREHPFFAAALESGALEIVGVRYDLDTGLVEVIVP